MFRLLKQYQTTWLIILGIVLLFFLFRLPNLTALPVFCDEAIYIRWAQVMKSEPTLRFLPLTDGKTPLYMWTMIPMFKLFDDPLLAGRVLSVLTGLATLAGVFVLGWKFFDKRVGLWASLLAAITPYLVFFDRMALADSMLAAFSIWSLNLSLLLIKNPRFDLAMVLGYLIGGGWLAKTPGMFNLLMMPLSYLVFNWSAKNRNLRLVKSIGLLALAGMIGFVMYNLLRLGPGFENLASRNQDYIHSIQTLLQHPLDPFIPHFRDLVDFLIRLLTLPVLVLVLIGIVASVKLKNRSALVVLLWSLIPLLAFTAALKATYTARYLLFSIPPLLVLGGWAITILSDKFKLTAARSAKVFPFILLPLAIFFNAYLVFDPAQAAFPRAERRGYIEDWTSGYGLKESADFLMAEAKNGPVMAVTSENFGTLPDGLLIYLDRYLRMAPEDQKLIFKAGESSIEYLQAEAVKRPTYYIANKSRAIMPVDKLKLIKEYPKGWSPEIPQESLLIYQVLPK